MAEDGTLANRRFFCHTGHGYPDGFKVDPRGWVWTTAADGIHIHAADRTRLGYIPPFRLLQLRIRWRRRIPPGRAAWA